MTQINDVLKYLEMSYIGANALDDFEAMVKIERAIAAIKAPTNMEIFTKKFKGWYNTNETKIN